MIWYNAELRQKVHLDVSSLWSASPIHFIEQWVIAFNMVCNRTESFQEEKRLKRILPERPYAEVDGSKRICLFRIFNSPSELIQKCGSWVDDTANGKCNKASEAVTGEDWSALLQAKKQDFTAQ